MEVPCKCLTPQYESEGKVNIVSTVVLDRTCKLRVQSSNGAPRPIDHLVPGAGLFIRPPPLL